MVQSQTTDICSSNALFDLTACLTKLCVNPVDTQSLVAGLEVSINPKLEYSCKMSMVPAASDDGVTLALNGSCSNSPYPFKSFFPQGVGSITSSNGCKIELYSDEDCLGSAGSVDIGTSQTGQCIFHGGKSARVACSNELDGESWCNLRYESTLTVLPSCPCLHRQDLRHLVCRLGYVLSRWLRPRTHFHIRL